MATKTSPIQGGAAVTPDDDADLPRAPTRGLMVTVAGNVSVLFPGTEGAVTLPALAVGIVHPFEVRRVRSTGTTATGIVALY